MCLAGNSAKSCAENLITARNIFPNTFLLLLLSSSCVLPVLPLFWVCDNKWGNFSFFVVFVVGLVGVGSSGDDATTQRNMMYFFFKPCPFVVVRTAGRVWRMGKFSRVSIFASSFSHCFDTVWQPFTWLLYPTTPREVVGGVQVSLACLLSREEGSPPFRIYLWKFWCLVYPSITLLWAFIDSINLIKLS